MEQQRGLCSFTPGESAGCGAGSPSGQPAMRLSVSTTTGSPVELSVPRGETVEGLRTHLSHKLRLPTDRIVLLFRDKQLTAGTLLDLGVTDGSRLTLVPAIEAGLLCSTARAERTMMDVLEGLTEVQISDFLSGRSPLTINLGVGAHMMYVQLQLSAQNVAELQHQQDLNATGPAPSPPPHTSAPDCSTSSIHLSAQRPRASFNSTAPTSSPLCAPPHRSCPPPSPSSSCPHPSCPPAAATPVCSPASSSSIPGPQSPAPASTFKESDVHVSLPAEPSKQPGAVIESFVSHSPGVFSGTFSGTLAPCSQSGVASPRRGVTIILQILNDLLRAACHHQGAPPASPRLRCPDSNPAAASPLLTSEGPSSVNSKTLETLRAENLSETAGEERRPICSSTQENQTLHCKLERLQFLLHQRRLRRRTRRNSQASQPYQHRHHRP